MRATLALLLTVFVSAAVSCGGDGGGSNDGGASADDWAADICTAVGEWARDVQDRAAQPRERAATVPEVRDQLGEFVDDVVKRTGQMISEIRAAKDPDVPDGDKIARDLLERLVTLETSLKRLRTRVASLPDDPEKFGPEAQKLGSEITTTGAQIGDQIDRIDDRYDAEVLSKAFAENAACKNLSG